jgi:hypothetical protein
MHEKWLMTPSHFPKRHIKSKGTPMGSFRSAAYGITAPESLYNKQQSLPYCWDNGGNQIIAATSMLAHPDGIQDP